MLVDPVYGVLKICQLVDECHDESPQLKQQGLALQMKQADVSRQYRQIESCANDVVNKHEMLSYDQGRAFGN